MKRLRSYVDRIATARRKWREARGRKEKAKWAARIKSVGAELKEYRRELKRRKAKLERSRGKVNQHEAYFGDRKPDADGLVFMQDYLYHRVNRPVPKNIYEKFQARVRKIDKKLKNASGMARLELTIERKYLTTRMRQTLRGRIPT